MEMKVAHPDSELLHFSSSYSHHAFDPQPYDIRYVAPLHLLGSGRIDDAVLGDYQLAERGCSPEGEYFNRNPDHCPTYGTKFFSQLIDHQKTYEDANNTFLYQYQLVDTYYQPGGLNLFFHSAESPLDCLEGTSLLALANELGGLVVSQEHRYFGDSCPYGLNYTERADWNPKLLEPLTLDNVFWTV